MEFLDTLAGSLAGILDQPPAAAAALGIACAFAVRQIWPALIAAVVTGGLAWTGHPWLCALVAACLAIGWLIDCSRYPKRDCLRCRGAGKFKRGFLWFVTSKECGGCGGAGRKIRLGTRVLTRVIGDYFV